MKVRITEDCDTIKGRIVVYATPRVIDLPIEEAARLAARRRGRVRRRSSGRESRQARGSHRRARTQAYDRDH